MLWRLQLLPADRKMLCRHAEKHKRAFFFQCLFSPEALMAAGTFIPTFALHLITALTWHFSVMLTELLCVEREACGLS